MPKHAAEGVRADRDTGRRRRSTSISINTAVMDTVVMIAVSLMDMVARWARVIVFLAMATGMGANTSIRAGRGEATLAAAAAPPTVTSLAANGAC